MQAYPGRLVHPVTFFGDLVKPLYFILFLKFILFIFLLSLAALGLHCCAWAFSSCGERGQCVGFSLSWLLLLWITGYRCMGFICCGTQAQ